MNKRRLPISEWKFKHGEVEYILNLVRDTCGPVSAFPGSGSPEKNQHEFSRLMDLFSQVSNKKNPCMVELGCHWALASLIFKKMYPNGRNVLVEPDLCNIAIGQMNFHLNNFACDMTWGSVFPCDPSIDPLDIGFSPDPKPRSREADFIKEIYKEFNLKDIDVLHMDIQGSEFPLVKYLDKNNFFNNIIKSVFIATHNIKEHHIIVKILQANDFNIITNEERTKLEDSVTRRGYLPEFKDKAYEFAKEINEEVEVGEDGHLFISFRESQTTDGLIIANKNA